VKKFAEAAGYSSPLSSCSTPSKQMDAAASPEDDRGARKTKGIGYVDFGLDI
jgi:hypothetical protein